MTALANARVDVMTALVSFERVFEVLDLPPMITERPDARALPDGPIGVRLRDVRFTYPRAEQVSLASLEDVAVLDQRGGEEVLHGVDLEVGARAAARARRALRCGQVDDRRAGPAALRRRRGRGRAGRDRRARPDVRGRARRRRRRHPGRAPVPRHDRGQPALRRPATRPTPSWSTRCTAPGWASCSPRCPTAWTRWWGSAATGSPAANASASRSPACCWPGRGW